MDQQALKAIIIDELLNWIFGGIQMFLNDHRTWLEHSTQNDWGYMMDVAAPLITNRVSHVMQQWFSGEMAERSKALA